MSERVITVDLDNKEAKWILSRMCFELSPIANIMQAAGQDVPKRTEHEQCHVMSWMLQMHAKHGDEKWRDEAEKELKALQDIIRKEGGAK